MSVTFCSLSVLGGWQTAIVETGQRIGPVFNSSIALGAWQKINLYREAPGAIQTIVW